MTVSPWCVRSAGIRRATGGSGGAPAGWPGGVAAIVVGASARVGLFTPAVYGRRPLAPRPPGLRDHGVSARRREGSRACSRGTPGLSARAGRRPVDPGREHDLAPVWVLVGHAAVVLPVVDLRNRIEAGSGQPGRDAVPGG